MKLRKLSMCNFQGRTGSYDFDDITIIVGLPFTGKTTIKNAATFLLVGHVPKLGKTTSASAELASGFPMSVVGLCDDNSMISRGLERKGKSVSMVVSDNMPAVPPVLLSPSVFFEMGPSERTQYVFSRIQLDEESFSTGSVVDAIMAVTLPAQDDAHKAALDEIAGELRNASDVRDAQSENKDPQTPSFQTWLTSQIEFAKEKLKEWKAAAKRYVGHEQTSEELAVRHGEAVSRSSAEINGDIQKLSESLSQQNRKRGELTSAQKTQKQWREQRDGFMQIINNPENTTLQAALTKAEQDRDALQKTTLDYQSRTVELTSKKREIVSAITQGDTRVAEIKRELVLPSNQMTAELESKMRYLSAERSRDVDDLRSLTDEFNKHLVLPCCPTCGTAGTDFAEKIKALYQPRLDKLSANIARIVAEHNSHGIQLQAERTRLAALLAEEKANLERQITENRNAILAMEGDITTSTTADVANQEARSKIGSLNQAIGTLRTKIEAYHNAKTSMETIGAEDTRDYDSELRVIDEELEGLQGRLNNARQELRDLGAAEAAAQKRAQAEQERLRANACVAVCSLVVEKLSELKDKAIAASIGPILTTANAFTQGLMKSPLELADCEFGRRENGTWVSHKVFSGTEELLAYAGISVALAAGKSPYRLVMMDELGRMDIATKVRVLTRVRELISAGLIDQFVGIDVTLEPYKTFEGVKVINV